MRRFVITYETKLTPCGEGCLANIYLLKSEAESRIVTDDQKVCELLSKSQSEGLTEVIEWFKELIAESDQGQFKGLTGYEYSKIKSLINKLEGK